MFFIFQDEVKSHVFFAYINWDDLVQKRIPPPFNPSVVCLYSYMYFSGSKQLDLLTNKKPKTYYKDEWTFFNCLSVQESQYDISNFDPEFTEESVPNSVCICKDNSIVNASVMEADDAFLGFSYAPPSDDSFL